MCGIAGIIRFDGKPVEDGTLAGMCEQLRHRGPDDAGWMTRGSAGIANTRLKIIDLSPAGRQPIFNEDGQVAVVLNGEIYNFAELRRDLESRGHVFRSSTDTEVIVHLYEEAGNDFVRRLDGMFAVALWDDRERKLILARDRAGKKPLFYYADSHLLAFASEIKALFVCPDVPREVESAQMGTFLALGYVPSPRTLFRGIAQLDPACGMVIDSRGRRSVSHYWNYRQPERPITKTQAKSELRARMEAAVRKRLISDVPLGAFLSGGMDSSIVVGLMAGLQREPVRTFSIGFENAPRFDERYYARLIARRFGTQHHEFVVEPQSISLLETLVRHHDQPFMDSSAVPTYLLAKLAREHVTVVLNGDGGDELFAGYRRFPITLAAERVPAPLLRALKPLSRSMRGFSPRFSAALLRLSNAGTVSPKYRLWSVLPMWASGLWRGLHPEYQLTADESAFEFLDGMHAKAEGLTPLSRLLYFNFHDYLLNDLLVKVDRSTMAHGLEARSPFLDTELIEFVTALPDKMKLNRLDSKVLLRDTFRDLLPRETLRRAKQGFGVPLSFWFRGELDQFVRDELGSPGAHVYQFLEFDFVQELIASLGADGAVHGDAIWTLLTLETWLKMQSEPRPEGTLSFVHITNN
ncbi:MAG: asparagine synthase (glutamine-hydrolyzing) [Verrucomicrobiales bacterium]|nr:asparagine synthase (glutamine-hydrolyzing) [Verrucomicrobiales bacterium]